MKIFKFTLLALLMVASFSCEDVLKVEPRQSIESSTALNSRDNILAATNSPYARLRALSSYGRNLIAFPEALSDNGQATNNSGRLIGEYQNLPGSTFNNWQNDYFAINEINLVLAALQDETVSPPLSAADKTRIEGEMKFLRALYYFNLVRVYAYDPGVSVGASDRGGVPITTTGYLRAEDALAFLPSRAPVADVYTLIYADLQTAIANLGNAVGRAPIYATKAAAQALLSRVALYNKDYATVVTNATEAFNTLGVGTFLSGNEYVSGWRALSNPESMFEVRFAVAAENIGVNESLQSSFTTIRSLDNLRNANGTLNTSSNTGGWGDLRPNAQLRGLLGVTTSGSGTGANPPIAIVRGADIRGFLYEVGPGRGAGAGIECIKFLGKTGTLYMDNVPVIRKSEMLLNRAEAYATAGSPVFDEDLARADLNQLRVARGLAAVDDTLVGSDLYEAILAQRRIELAFEGHRWFDLKRLGRDIPKPVTGGLLAYTDFRLLANIPTREVDGNPNLEQNPGY